MECTALLLLYRSSHLTISSGETRRLDRSIYPFSLSTRSTTTTSVRPTRISLLIERIRLQRGKRRDPEKRAEDSRRQNYASKCNAMEVSPTFARVRRAESCPQFRRTRAMTHKHPFRPR